MSKKKKKKTKKVNNKQKLENKKILDGVDLITKENNEKDSNITDKVIEKKKDNENINEHIQSFVSLLFTVIIFLAFILLIIVLYNNYLKKDNNKCDVSKVCQDYIEKDYNISRDLITKFIKDTRVILYNIDSFDINNYNNDNLLNLATYFIWGNNSEYLECNKENDNNCLVTKKEIDLSTLKKYFKKYLNIKKLDIKFNNSFQDDDSIRLYLQNDKVILTFQEFEYETPKHDIVDINVSEDEINIIFALSKKMDTYCSYIGYKKIKLRYIDEYFVIEKIDTTLNS